MKKVLTKNDLIISEQNLVFEDAKNLLDKIFQKLKSNYPNFEQAVGKNKYIFISLPDDETLVECLAEFDSSSPQLDQKHYGRVLFKIFDSTTYDRYGDPVTSKACNFIHKGFVIQLSLASFSETTTKDTVLKAFDSRNFIPTIKPCNNVPIPNSTLKTKTPEYDFKDFDGMYRMGKDQILSILNTRLVMESANIEYLINNGLQSSKGKETESYKTTKLHIESLKKAIKYFEDLDFEQNNFVAELMTHFKKTCSRPEYISTSFVEELYQYRNIVDFKQYYYETVKDIIEKARYIKNLDLTIETFEAYCKAGIERNETILNSYRKKDGSYKSLTKNSARNVSQANHAIMQYESDIRLFNKHKELISKILDNE